MFDSLLDMIDNLFSEHDLDLSGIDFDSNSGIEHFIDVLQMHGVDLSNYSPNEIRDALESAISSEDISATSSGLNEIQSGAHNNVSFTGMGICGMKCLSTGCAGTISMSNPSPISYSAGEESSK